MEIQLFVPTYRIDECLQEIRQCLEKGWTGLGYKTVEFEKAWTGYTGLPYAHFVNSATAGLHIAVDVLKKRFKWQDGDEIITTPITFVSTNHVILYENLKPVFADVDQYVCLDPEDVKRKITKKTRAVIFVGLGGNTGQYEKIVDICRQNRLALILDAAHMAGTRLHGRQVGAEADVSVFSFHAVKNLPTADGGMVCFAEGADDALARKLTWLGINKDTYSRTMGKGVNKWKYDVEEVGFKYHGNSVMAAIGLVQLKYLDHDNTYRRQLADWYTQSLKDIEGVELVPVYEGCESARHLYQIMIRNRDELLLALNEEGIFPGVHYLDNTEYTMYRYAKGTCPRAAEISTKIISLPLHLRMGKKEVDFICRAIKKLMGTRWRLFLPAVKNPEERMAALAQCKEASFRIEGKRVILRALQSVDLQMTMDWRNQDSIRKAFIDSSVITRQRHQNWWKQYQQRRNDFVFIVEGKRDSRPIGQLSLYDLDLEKRTAEFGRFMIGEPDAGSKGYAQEAIDVLLSWAFNQFDLEYVYLRVRSDNAAAIRIYNKCGFTAVKTNDSITDMRLTKQQMKYFTQ